MHPEKPECRYCGGCRDEHKHYYAGKNIQDSHWLEYMGDMISVAVKGMKQEPSYSDYCHEMLSRNKNIYT